MSTDVETVEEFDLESGDLAAVSLFTVGKDEFPVRLAVGDEDGRSTAWMTADEAEALAHRLLGVARRAQREGRQA